jgi:hypothetical protein
MNAPVVRRLSPLAAPPCILRGTGWNLLLDSKDGFSITSGRQRGGQNIQAPTSFSYTLPAGYANIPRNFAFNSLGGRSVSPNGEG